MNNHKNMDKGYKYSQMETCTLANTSKAHQKDTDSITGKVEHFIEVIFYQE